MRYLAAFLVIISTLSVVLSSALTTTIEAAERSCFYANVDKKGEKIGFYFAVQSGGNFDIDWEVIDPEGNVVVHGEKERQGDFIFTGNHYGEYKFCFYNRLSSMEEKLVDFDILVESEPRHELPKKTKYLQDSTQSLEDSLYKIQGQVSTLQRNQRYFRTRENRNISTVNSTKRRLKSYAIFETLAVILMSCAQVWIVKNFFNMSSTRYKV
ncbi:hypothetical protein E3Q22_01747 [Wallemia mellicola]|uniref:GOLD domain-containing protein n=2 Tax=Wallemia mellicola TaxID=1708541 RepID=A0A4T0MPY5_9BASI|nr:hypothetical protein WALSEDRAFT_59648 [Wallemia mellicola CBS 633.66]TIB72101.1 hypothetical protein E3Q24_01904 [Wallemia mellicola]EIM22857.1 hypothetical protein WALSEDRAFT_59648 [Wallemia mellicola CBS 633.66]TIB77029.1 hypothetical protein E3Q23_01530 [Wallemia mellicola]TIB80685.1 hypothetical protein E3Q22_01747 [Wallemia mellicola]TIB85675.1 hypothetical protein E3Q21_01927 [Wallemia mellicola]|eukprot:XP_006956906.1 hypothetical protein WALSEDRAFT_59648 [Wallemia mellicola CBS 633.66]